MAKKIMVPNHIALIPDGNRRWAKAHKFKLLFAYDKGIKKFIEFARWAKEFGVKDVTVWALSTENLKGRTHTELDVLFRLYTKAATDRSIIKELKENKARLNIIGNINVLPKRLKDALKEAERQTRMYKDLTINLLINYGGKEDLLYSMQRVARSARQNRTEKIDEALIKENLRSSQVPDIDLIVRTSGETRLSGLLPWQGGYSELYFARKYWPDFNKQDLKRAIDTYSRRQRRFGK